MLAGGLAPAGAQDAAAPPPDPALEACAAERCLGVGFTAALSAALGSAEPVDLAALAEGLVFSHRGAPLDVRLIAARYDDNRLVRYGVSERAPVGGEAGVVIPGAAAAVTKALEPATNRIVEIAAFDGEGAGAPVPLTLQSFVGNVPPTYLVGEPGSALLAEGAADGASEGSLGVLVLEPEAAELRDGMAAESFGALVRLALKRP